MIKFIIHKLIALFTKETYALVIPWKSIVPFASLFNVSVSQLLLAEAVSLIKFKYF